jgi:hypothetical protein
MRRQRSIPWIHRYSRPITAGIASIGAAITAYLTVAFESLCLCLWFASFFVRFFGLFEHDSFCRSSPTC